MSDWDKYHNKINQDDDDGDSSGSASTGGKSGQIEFRDFLAPASSRDSLPPAELKRLLYVQSEGQIGRVQKQKERRDQYRDLKEGKLPLQAYRQERYGNNSGFKQHPILANKAQFSGIDSKVNPLPNEQVAETNNDARLELEHRLQNRLTLSAAPAPTFNPKPMPR